jgi:hypothetical protein
MSALPVIETGLLLGVYALLAGVWGLLYAVGRRLGRFRLAAAAAYGLHSLVAMVIVLWAPLGFGWKCLLVAGSVAFWSIPPVVWRFLEHTHSGREFGA